MNSVLDRNGVLYFWSKIKALVNTKQDPINDLSDIRTGAALGATALQAEADPVFTASPAASISGSDITNWNSKTDNAGTITGITMNGVSKGASGVVDLGTVLTSVTKEDVNLGNVTNDPQVKRAEMGVANGVATLDGTGKIPNSQLPSYVDDVIEVYPKSGAEELSAAWLSTTANGAAITPESGKIYILMAASENYDLNAQFRWSGSQYTKISDSGFSILSNSEIDAICV